MGHAGSEADQRTEHDWPQDCGDEDAKRQPSLVSRHSGSGIGQPLQRTQCRQPGLDGVERIARFSGILLNLAGDFVKDCFEFTRTWWQAIGFMALRGIGGPDNRPPQPAPVPAELEGFVETGTWPGMARNALRFSVRFVHKQISFSGRFVTCEGVMRKACGWMERRSR